MNDDVATGFLAESKHALDQEHRRIRHCLRQLSREQVWRPPTPELNSIGVLLRHLCGNLRQWLLHGLGGERDVRNRMREFGLLAHESKEALLEELGAILEEATRILDGLDETALLEPRRIQGFETTVLAAIYSTVTHLEGHALQIAYLTHWLTGDRYEPFWKPDSPEQGSG